MTLQGQQQPIRPRVSSNIAWPYGSACALLPASRWGICSRGGFYALAALEYASVNLVVAVLIWAMVAFANRTRTRFAAA